MKRRGTEHKERVLLLRKIVLLIKKKKIKGKCNVNIVVNVNYFLVPIHTHFFFFFFKTNFFSKILKYYICIDRQNDNDRVNY